MADDLSPEEAALLALLDRVDALESRLAKVEAWAERERRRMADEVLRLKMMQIHASRERARRSEMIAGAVSCEEI